MGWRDEGPAGRTRRAAAIRHECPSLAWRGLGPGPKRTPEHHIDLRVSNDAQSGETSEIGMSYTRGKTVTDTGRHRTREHNERLPQKKVHSGGTWHEHLDTADRKRPGREKSGGSGLQEKKKKVSRNKAALNHSWLHHSNRDRCDNDTSGKSGKTSDTQQSHSAQLSQAAHSKHTQAASPGKQEAWLGDSFRHRDRPKPVKRIGWTSKTALNRKGPIGTDRKDHKHKRDREESDRPQRIPGSHTWGGGPKMTP
ncbi:hypothetical protein T4D_13731 [Trichinella pseudospiralis]|uniref:Uncharacterized protein n=1 Tax=Trichinella pseudospiralis TaxID=6337 RepID=A0A0V1F4I7_TRIPS|nr:hypothetical protein T4D_13731 [Trichinella pseudospiralis]